MRLEVEFDSAETAKVVVLSLNGKTLQGECEGSWVRATIEAQLVHLGKNRLKVQSSNAGTIERVETIVRYTQ